MQEEAEALLESVVDSLPTSPQRLDIYRCRARIAQSVWWPGINYQISQVIQNCSVCAKSYSPRPEPLIVTQLPEYRWQVVGTDLFELDGQHYLLIVDYFSRYPEVLALQSTTSTATSVFSRHGVPEVLRSDNGPQFSLLDFAKFASSWEFNHITIVCPS